MQINLQFVNQLNLLTCLRYAQNIVTFISLLQHRLQQLKKLPSATRVYTIGNALELNLQDFVINISVSVSRDIY